MCTAGFILFFENTLSSGKSLNENIVFFQDYVKDSNKYNSNLAEDQSRDPYSRDHHSRDHPSQNTQDVDPELEQELGRVNDKLKSLNHQCEDIMENLTDTAAKNKKYQVLKAAECLISL